MAARVAAPGTIELTRRGWTMTGAGAGLIVGSRVLGAGPLAALGIAGGVLVVLALAWVAGRRPELAVDRHARPARLHVGAQGRVVLAGRAVTATPLLTLVDRVDEGRRAARFLVAPLSAGAPLDAAYRVPTDRRGRFVFGPLLASVADPLGLARRSWVVADETDVVVRPRVHAVSAPRRGGGGEPAIHAEGARAPAVEPLGEFLALRDYAPGDDPRLVHWRSTARLGDLVVRQDEAASPGSVVLVLDTRGRVHDERSFEVAVEAVASIAVRCRQVHAPVEVLTTGGELLGRSGAGLELLLDRLAIVEPADADHLAAVVGALRNRLGVGAVVAVTGTADRALLDAMALARSHTLVTAVVTRAGAIDARPGLAVVDASAEPFRDAWNASVRRRARTPHRAKARSRWIAGTSSSR
jgi:uncharacterized protein (DUF58 family)